MVHCRGLNRIYLCISNKDGQHDVDKAVLTLEKLLQNSGIEVSVGLEGLKKDSGLQKENGLSESCQDYLVIGDDDLIDERGVRYAVDIGISSCYRGGAPFVIYDIEDIDEQYINLVWTRKCKRPLVIAQTQRLIIREMSIDDLDGLYELYDSLKTCPYIEQLYAREKEEEFERKYIENMYGFFGYGLWLVFLKDTGKLVGRVGIENREIDGETVQELGYLVDARYQKKHIAWESCQAVLAYAKNQLCLRQIYTCIHMGNKKSIALAEKLGFKAYAMDINGMNIYKSILL
ncbi:MAG: GNAT family N-acetyltransferase [Eubacteriales bacterium]|nr:GNAT family N-acetyltransferase [Eubacteriales bacterium]